MKQILTWTKDKHLVWFLILALIFILPRGLSMDRFITVDEVPWLMRSANFYYALGQREFSQTYQGRNPAVTTMWVNTAAFLIEYPEYRGYGQGYFDSGEDFHAFLESKGMDPLKVLVTGRRLMLLENLILILISFGIMIRLIGLAPAFSVFFLIALDPFHISLTMVSHIDGQLSCLMLLSIVSFLGYYYDKKKIIYLVLSAVAASLACLTKLPGYLLIPAYFLLIVIHYFNEKKTNKDFNFRTYIKKNNILRDVLLWVGIFILVYFILWPAMLVNPIGMIWNQVIAPFHFVDMDNVVTQYTVSDLDVDSSSALNGIVERITYYPLHFLWKTTPIVIIGLVLALIGYIIKVQFFANQEKRDIVKILAGFSLFYIAALSIVSFSGGRYIIPAIVLLDMLSALGWYAFFQWILAHNASWVRYLSFYGLLIGILAVQIGGNVAVHPYYYSYYNPLLGGGKKASEVRFIGSGEGLDQAGRYLESKPDASDLTVMSWYSACLDYFFSGKVVGVEMDYLKNVDYLVVYTNQWYRRTPAELFDILDNVEPEHTIWINDIEYVRIYDVKRQLFPIIQ